MKHISPKYLFYLILILKPLIILEVDCLIDFERYVLTLCVLPKTDHFLIFSIFFCFRKLDQRCWTMREKKYLEIEDTSVFYTFYYINFEITGDPCNPIGSHQYNLFMNHTIFFSKLHLFPSHWKTLSKTQQPIRCQGLFMVTNQIRGLRKKDNFCNF